MNATIRTLTLYAREWCGLCDEMYAALHPWCERLGFDIDVVYIDDDAALVARYGTRVPVLSEGGQEICHYFLDEQALRRHLDAPGP